MIIYKSQTIINKEMKMSNRNTSLNIKNKWKKPRVKRKALF